MGETDQKREKTGETGRKRLARRAFPDIDNTLYCLAVRMDDELAVSLQKDQFSASDIKRLTDIADLLLLVRKTAPKLAEKKAKHKKMDPQLDNLLDDDVVMEDNEQKEVEPKTVV